SEYIEYLETALFQCSLKGRHIEPIAGKDSYIAAPLSLHRSAASSHIRIINYIIVNESGRMQKLHYRGHANYALTDLCAKRASSQNQKSRPDSFSAGLLHILPDVSDDLHIRADPTRIHLLDTLQLRFDERIYLAWRQMLLGLLRAYQHINEL